MGRTKIHFSLAIPRTDHEAITRAAMRAGITRSEWSRIVLMRAVELEERGLPLSLTPTGSGAVMLESKDHLAAVLASSPLGAVVADPRGICLVGETPQGEGLDRAIFVIDIEQGVIGLVTPQAETQLPLSVPLLADFAEVLHGAIAQSRKAAIAGTPEQVEVSWGNRVRLSTLGANCPQIEINGLVFLLSDVQLLQLQAEVCGLLVRETYRGLQQRRSLETLLKKPEVTHAQ